MKNIPRKFQDFLDGLKHQTNIDLFNFVKPGNKQIFIELNIKKNELYSVGGGVVKDFSQICREILNYSIKSKECMFTLEKNGVKGLALKINKNGLSSCLIAFSEFAN